MTITKLVPVAALFVVTGLVSGYGLRPGPGVAPAVALQPEKAATKLPVPPPAATAEQTVRDDELKRLHAIWAKLQAQIGLEERNIRMVTEVNAFGPSKTARADRRLELLETELFTIEREIAELHARRDFLREKLAAGSADRELARIEQDVRVKTLAAEVLNGSQKLVNLREKLGPTSPSVLESEKRVEDAKKLLTEMRGKVRTELRQLPELETPQGVLIRIAEIEEKVVVMERVAETRKRLRDNLERQLEHQHATRAGRAVDVTSQIEALKPKKELAAKLQSKIAEWEVEAALTPKPAPPSGVEAKLDVLIREVEALRKDVGDLKKR